MKLIYIANARIPTEKAHGYQITKMCEQFSKAGHDVELWIPTRNNLIKEDLFSFYGLKDNFKVVEIKGIDFIGLEKYFGKLSYWFQVISFLIRLSFLKVKKDTVIYTRNPEIIWLFSKKGCKTVYETHKWPKNKEKLHNLFIKNVYKVVVLTKGLKNLFLKNGTSETKIMVAPDGVDLETFDINLSKEQARNELNLPTDKLILGYTGSFRTMSKDKGILDILKSLKIISKDYPNIFFIAVGGSKPDIKYYQQVANDLKIEDKVSLITRVNLDKLAIYQKSFDVLLMPFPNIEHYAYYMSPLKMFEYMVSGRPIIASDLPSVREVLNENNAILVKPDCPEDLANGIKKILENRQIVENMVKQAYFDIKNYTWENRVWKIIKFIQ